MKRSTSATAAQGPLDSKLDKKTPDFSKVTTFEEFYPLYLNEHSNRTNRRLHFIGSTLVLICFATFLLTG